MSEILRVLGVDPSLRNTGLSVVTYNTEKKCFLPPSHCQVLCNPTKYTGKDAIMSMLDMVRNASLQDAYRNVDMVIIESPAVMFNKAWAAVTISMISHISGGAIALFGIEKTMIFRPAEWNKGKKKSVTHNQTVALLGDPDKWHYSVRIKSDKLLEHILDAASMALWYIQENYVEE